MLELVLNSGERELDMFQLTGLIALPAFFALLLLVVPAKWKTCMKWLALVGTVLTLVVALCTWVDWYNLLDSRSDRSVRSMYHPATSLEARADYIAKVQATGEGKYLSDDLMTRRGWIDRFRVDYSVGVDGINLLMVLLTCVVMVLAVVASWKIEQNLRLYLMLLLILQSGVLGAFLSMDLFLFYVFYEIMLLPMYFLVGLWGGEHRKKAAMKFVIYTLVGSVLLLSAIIALSTINVRDFVPQATVELQVAELKKSQPGLSDAEAKQKVEVHSFDFNTLSKAGRAAMLILTQQEARLTTANAKEQPENSVALLAEGVDRTAAIERLKQSPICNPTFQYVVFALLFLGFAVKVPIVPLHSWLPEAHVEAPTPVSMILAGVLLKLGGYGLIRFAFPLCPWAASELSWYVGLLGVISMAYGALVALGQSDFKRLLAYSSISHMGYVVLGLASWGASGTSEFWEWGVNGALYQMVAHGVTATALFFIVGVVYERAHHRDLKRLGGLSEAMPVFTGLSAILFFASMGLPGLCGFVGEFQVMMGAWKCCWGLATVAILTTILTAAYLLWAWQRVYFGTNPATKDFPDVTAREWAVLLPLVLLSIALGVMPGMLVTSWAEPSVHAWVQQLAVLKK
jgi:NADH-quinone oxidoreductase subunit M